VSDVPDSGEDVTRLLDQGLVRYAVGMRGEAIRMWEEALEQSPGNARALDYLQSVGALSPSAIGPDVDLAPAGRIDSVGLATLDRGGESLIPPFTPEPAAYEELDSGTEEALSDPMVADVDILVREAKEREQAGEYEEALRNCEEALRRDPEHAEALALVETLRVELKQVYLKELEPLERVPYLRATDSSILELSLDPVGGFLISQIDGEITLEDLLTILGTFDQFRVLSSLHYFLVNEIIEIR
jgi:tetratricopeptide (TPR) repeat protein